LCVLDELTEGGLIARVARVGAHFEQRVKALAARRPIIKEVRACVPGLGTASPFTMTYHLLNPSARFTVADDFHGAVINACEPLVLSRKTGPGN